MKLRLLGPAIVTTALVGTALTGGVAVAQTHSTLIAKAAAAPSCLSGITYVKALQTMNVRKSASTSGTAVGTWDKGKRGYVCNDGKPITGKWYTKCGKTSNKWLYVRPYDKNIEGYVPQYCTDWR
ncbi:hypothetical protein [Streptomyces sp. NPDC021622]|uniref:hypothetical protein n=1 Tax=Streptomyces sp. NPDC021622 TaxID=3155013 RepID=UPI00340B9109